MRISGFCRELALAAARCLAIVAVLFFGVVYLQHVSTRYSVQTAISQDGGVIFEHEDRETTEILNYLSGKEDLSREGKLAAVRSAFANLFYPNNAPSGIDEMDEAGLILLCRRFRDCVATEKNWLRTMPPPFYDERMYEALWEIEQIAGNPKIRWGRGGPRVLGNVGSNRYFHSSNTIHLSPPVDSNLINTVYDFVDEAAHGKQYNDRPLHYALVGLREELIVGYSVITEGKPYRETYDRVLYRRPGTIEYEAHKIIAPELRKKLFRKKFPR